MTVQTKAWDEVGKRFEMLGTDVRARMHELGENASEDREAFEKSVREMFAALEDGLGQARAIMSNPAFYKDMSSLVRSVQHALDISFEAGLDKLRTAVAPPSAGDGTRLHTPSKVHRTTTGTKPAAARMHKENKTIPH